MNKENAKDFFEEIKQELKDIPGKLNKMMEDLKGRKDDKPACAEQGKKYNRKNRTTGRTGHAGEVNKTGFFRDISISNRDNESGEEERKRQKKVGDQ